MYEAWEARSEDIDYAVAHARGIPIVGVNEHHPACGSFRFVGDLAVWGANQNRWRLSGARIAVFSDNLFADPIEESMNAAGATVSVVTSVPSEGLTADIVVVAVTPLSAPEGTIQPTELSAAIVSSGAHGCVPVVGRS